jgi:hypothetical protein
MVVGKLRLAVTAPRAVITAATWLSLWVSTPRMISSVAMVSWSGWAGCGMLGTVVCLLTARNGSATAGPAQVVRTVTVPRCGKAPIGTHPPVRRQQTPPQASADRSSRRHHGQSYRGSDPTRDGTPTSSQPYRDVEELLPSAASRWTTSLSTDGSSGSRRCSPRPPDHAAIGSGLAGASMRPT